MMDMIEKLHKVLHNLIVTDFDGGQRIDAKLPRGEDVHIMKYDDSPAVYVAIGDVPEYGSAPLSLEEATAKILRAAR